MAASAAQVGADAVADAEPVVLVHEVDEDVEEQGQSDEEAGPAERLGRGNDMGAPIDHPEVQGQHRQHEDDKADPDQ
jgi:hypothetical protein